MDSASLLIQTILSLFVRSCKRAFGTRLSRFNIWWISKRQTERQTDAFIKRQFVRSIKPVFNIVLFIIPFIESQSINTTIRLLLEYNSIRSRLYIYTRYTTSSSEKLYRSFSFIRQRLKNMISSISVEGIIRFNLQSNPSFK